MKKVFKHIISSSTLYEEQHITSQGLLLLSGIPPEEQLTSCYKQRKQTLFLMQNV